MTDIQRFLPYWEFPKKWERDENSAFERERLALPDVWWYLPLRRCDGKSLAADQEVVFLNGRMAPLQAHPTWM
jgi:hypothetical protein